MFDYMERSGRYNIEFCIFETAENATSGKLWLMDFTAKDRLTTTDGTEEVQRSGRLRRLEDTAK